jgi:hypothetical protein
MSPHEKGFDGLSQVFEQMPSVADLRRQRGTLSCAIDLGPSAVPTDYLHFGMGFQPGDH